MLIGNPREIAAAASAPSPAPGDNSNALLLANLQVAQDPVPNTVLDDGVHTVTFTVTLANDGPDTATGIEVTDAVPAGLTDVVVDVEESSCSLPAVGSHLAR